MAIPDDPRTVEELFAATLQGDNDDEAAWEAVRLLQLRATPAVFDFAKKYCRSDDPKARARGLSVLAQIGYDKPVPDRPYLGECVSIAIGHLKDPDTTVVRSAAFALGHLRGDQAISALIEIRLHPDAGVRYAVAVGMHGCPETPAIQTLVELMEDPDDGVRNWATFGLGQSDADSVEIREALRKRLEDPFGEARDEAVWGLAKRKDSLGLQTLLERLESGKCTWGDESAAEDVLGLMGSTPVEELRLGLRKLLQLN